MNHLLTHTPVYVWMILALVVARGLVALRERETTLKKLCIIPAIMLPVALLDIARKFGLEGLALGAWVLAVTASMWAVWSLGGRQIAAGGAPGTVRVGGSVMPLVLMLLIFMVKYATTVMLVTAPTLLHSAAVTSAACALMGGANGWFFGRLLRDVLDARAAGGGIAQADIIAA
ncbi:hypothetical protein LK540_04115 [Massilia sp. IC2-278]|uniref:DUF6622 family protein n=1 Tax=Massilia sp. IC2-278 TaxID=2887200 RepID=UPI001E2FD10D|nr:DUF6622 family protein [Massilia sp. IC2-278]MCC2959612.1 hypothetical protein [Massilia sp. IC2-278]